MDSISIAIANLNKCGDAIEKENLITNEMLKDFLSSSKSPMLKVEDNLLEMASSGSTDSSFYCTVLQLPSNQIYARFFESGGFSGFFRNIAHQKLKETLDVEYILPYQVYTSDDIRVDASRSQKLYSSLKKDAPNKRNQSDRAYARNLKTNTKSICNIINNFIPSIESGHNTKCLFLCLYVMYRIQKFESTSDNNRRYMVCNTNKELWEQLMLKYRTNKATSLPKLSLFYSSDDSLSLEDQFFFISTIPNLHKWPWFDDKDKKMEVKFEQRFSSSCARHPRSPRNRILQACTYREEYNDIVVPVLYSVSGVEAVTIPYPKSKHHPSNRRKRPFKSIVQPLVQNENIDSPVDMAVNDEDTAFENVASYKEGLFHFFCGQLFNHGKFVWRIKNDERCVVVMNDYDPTTGDFRELDFVHISSEHSTVGPIYHCTCDTFTILLPDEDMPSSSNDVRWKGTSCMHARLLAAVLSKVSSPASIVEPVTQDSTLVDEKVVQETSSAFSKVVELPAKMGISRFSVISEDDYAFVTIANVVDTARKIVSCHNSICGIGKGCKRSLDYLFNSSDLCIHLQVVRDHLISTGYEENDDSQSDVDDEILPDEKWKEIFEEATGEWKYYAKCPSQRKIDDNPFSTTLEYNLSVRDLWVKTDTPSFKPSSDGTCNCGAGWISDQNPDGILIFDCKTALYLEKHVIQCSVLKRSCINQNCVRTWDGSNESIFRFSRQTCFGHEIGWEFVCAVETSGQSFNGFVALMNERYRRRDSSTPGFMSTPVFINCFFAWISLMKLEFRQQCKACGGISNILACDGTKLGVNFKNAFVKPIESIESSDAVETKLKRLNRCFIFNRTGPPDTYRTARMLLEKCCEQILNSGGTDLDINPITNCLDEYSKPAFLRMLSNSIDDKEKKSLATFFKLLSSDSSVDTILPLRFCDDINQFIDIVNQRTVSMQELRIFIYKSKFFCPELSNLILSSALAHDQLPHADIMQLLQYLVYFVRNIHSYDEPAVDPEPIPGTYNPAKYGRAYYFNAHGCQVRKLREFSIDKKKDVQQSSIFDDKPDMPCNKRYPAVSKKGVTYAFLWFCPLHGHCYGYHIIPGSEGRKDPSASLLTHSNTAPDDILYDFACSLSEYTKNRESGFFAKTRFFHDVFHGYVHKCTSAFKCNRLLGTNAINSSICEQFNSYIQKIKRSSKLMSQNHFALYLQFFIHIWNQKKKNTFQKKLNIAASGRQLPNNDNI